MSGKIRRVDYYPDEFISGVGGVLRADEQGVYWMVCSLIMSEGGPVTFEPRRLAGLCLLRPADVKRIVGALVERGKLAMNEGKLCQKRAQSEIERAANRIQSASENGSKGGRPKQKTEQNQQTDKAGGSAGEKLTNNHQPPTKQEVSSDEDTGARNAPASTGTTPRNELRTVLDAEHAEAVIAHRNKLRASLTVRAAKLLAGKFARCDDPNAAADEMIAAGWRGFEPEWMEGRTVARGRSPPNGSRPKSGMMDVISEMLDDDSDRQRESEDQGDWGTVRPRCLPAPGAGRN